MQISHTPSFIWAIISCIILSSCRSTRSTLSSPLTSTLKVLQTDRLEWIKSAGDFDQKGLTADQIDERIARLVQQAVDSNRLTVDIDIPINNQKLEYLEQINPFSLNEVKKASPNSLNHYNKLLHIYKYGDFYISTQTDTQTDQMNVYYTARAFEILKTRYPEAYRRLFIDTKQFLANEPKYGTWLNRNKAFWIGFNVNPTGFASNNHFFITEANTPLKNSTSVNIAAVNIHESKILGTNLNEGSGLVYKRVAAENYRLHMREGLIVSIVHEMVHNYIQYATPVSDQYQKASSLRNEVDGGDTEEAVVVNTTYQYFRRKGGLMNEQEVLYYPSIFDPYLLKLTNKNLLVKYATHYSTVVPTNTNLRDVFIITGIFD